jgi:hypothetical protein
MTKLFKTLLTVAKNYIWVMKLVLWKYKADRLAFKHKQAHYLLILNGKLSLITKDWFVYNRQRGVFPKEITSDKLSKIALYVASPKNKNKYGFKFIETAAPGTSR